MRLLQLCKGDKRKNKLNIIHMKTLRDFDFNGKRALARCDFNVPVENGKVQDDFRIKAVLPTIEYLKNAGAKVILMSHLEDSEGKNLSLKPVKEKLEEYLNDKISIADDCVGKEVEENIIKMRNSEILLLENLRMRKEEKENSKEFAKQLSELGDIYVNDAFSVCHRTHASVVGVPKILPSCAGLLLEKEIKILSKIMENPERPLVAIIGGAKISAKAKVIDKFLKVADHVLLGGKIANAILQIKGIYKDGVFDNGGITDEVKNINLTSTKLHLPVDVIVSADAAGKNPIKESAVGKLEKGELIFDLGPETITIFSAIIKEAETIIWAGPMGLFEVFAFENGTKRITKAIAENENAFKVIGGGDTISAVSKFNLLDKFDHVSTGGSAMLEFLGGEKLPGIEVLG